MSAELPRLRQSPEGGPTDTEQEIRNVVEKLQQRLEEAEKKQKKAEQDLFHNEVHGEYLEQEAANKSFHDEVHIKSLAQELFHNEVHTGHEKAIQDEKTKKLEEENKQLGEEATIDHLTQVDNRKTFESKLKGELERIRKAKSIPEEHRKQGEPIKTVALVAVDIDHFKDINDKLGHPVGDKVLAALGKLLRESTRGGDSVARVGGEEFMVLMPGATAQNALRHAEELRKKIAALRFEGHPDLRITASFGAADSGMTDDPAVIYKYADNALYAAKKGGRDRVVVYAPSGGEEAGLAEAG